MGGYVFNEKNQPLANVSVVAKQGSVIKVFDVTTNAGFFTLSLLQKQNYTLEFSIIGYDRLITNLKTSLSNEQKYFTLKQKYTPEDTVMITAKRGVYEKGDTVFYNADYYKRNNENNLKDLLSNMPGLQVLENGKIMADGEFVSKILIDGKDLTGENYEKIVNNFSPHGLDQIQVLKKYKDPFELSNTANGNTEVAINLTFKNKKIIPSAKISSSIGIPIKYYEHKTDFLVLTKPVTAINFININAIGNSAQLISSPNSLFGNVSTDAFKKLGKGLPYQNTTNELFLKITKNFYSFNTTQYFDNSSQFNIGKKITNKFSVNYTPEKIQQTENGSSKTFIDNQLFAETNSFNNPIINRKVFSVKNEMIFMLKKHEQLKYNFSILAEKESSSSNNLLNLRNVVIKNDNKKLFGNSLINYTKFLEKEIVLNIAVFYDLQHNTEFLNNNGVLYNDVIFSNTLGLTKMLEQRINVREQNIGTYLKLIKRKKDHSFTFQPTFKKINGRFQSNLSALATTNIPYANVDSFRNDYSYKQVSITTPIKYKFDVYNFEINLLFEPIFLNSDIHNISNKIANYNTSINTNYQFKNRRSIRFSLTRNNDFSFLTKLFAANVIINNSNKISKTGFLLQEKSYNLNVGSNKGGAYSNKPNFSYTISGNYNTPNYLLNANNNNFYSVQNYVNYFFVNKGITAAISNNITSQKLNIRFENTVTFSSRQSVSSQNTFFISSISNAYQITNRIISRFENFFNFQINNTLSYTTNKRKESAFFNKATTNITSLEVNINYMKKSHLDIEARNYYFNTYNAKPQNVLLLKASYKQLFNKNKIRLNIELNNLTNRNAFISQYTSITQFNETRVSLLPFFALLKLEFLL
ncbi:MAG: carboxypeptidase-like regulatory domain-containing protein [Ferruginibacter sp.]